MKIQKKKKLQDKELENIANEFVGLDVEELDLLKQIQASKDTTVKLSMNELQGLTKEEKIELFKQKQQQYREEKQQSQTKSSIDKERQRREGIKAQQEAQKKKDRISIAYA